jgi:hypothetical protein
MDILPYVIHVSGVRFNHNLLFIERHGRNVKSARKSQGRKGERSL